MRQIVVFRGFSLRAFGRPIEFVFAPQTPDEKNPVETFAENGELKTARLVRCLRRMDGHRQNGLPEGRDNLYPNEGPKAACVSFQGTCNA